MGKYHKSTSTKIIAVNSSGVLKDLLYIDETEEYLSHGDYKKFIRVTVLNHKENARDSFYFDVEDDYGLTQSFIQTSEQTMELLNMYMMLVQDRTDLNKFVIEAEKKLMSDFGYSHLRMVNT